MFRASFIAVAGAATTWEEFKQEFGRAYNGDEEQHREQVFNFNVAYINAENAKGHSHILGVGPFADLTSDEFKALPIRGYTASDLPVLDVHVDNGEAVADRLDWTEQGVVTAVKDQGQCGSCWAFSTTGALESGLKLHRGDLVELSEQQLVDCAGFPNMGCNGGNMGFALRFAKDHDFCTEGSYKYEAKGGSCRSSSCTVGMTSGTVTGVKSVAPRIGNAKDSDLKSALAVQPLSIAIEADQDIFQHYKSGTITGNCGTSTDHGVLLVGYGTDSAGNDYWKVKNSWGSSWGSNGYVNLVQGKNQCGINSGPNYPLFGSSVTV
jgi:cathepsin L